MKIGPERGPEVPLAVEIIEVIADLVAESAPDLLARQKSLWSLCLVNRAWYSASVKLLYSRPMLGSKSFELFVRTICPPVSSQSRAVGLEDLVMELHMGDMAYLSTKSTTAKLLRRTKKSLQIFVAPSHSMSISSLAPISKLYALQSLDLSRDKYDFSFELLLKATQSLDRLTYFSLPRGAIDDYNSREDTSPWPQSLATLQVNSSVPALSTQRQKFFSGLPGGLTKLFFRYIQNWRQVTLLFIGELHHAAPAVRELTISDVGGETLFREEFNLSDVVTVFPALEKLELPITALHFAGFLYNPAPWSHGKIPWKQSRLGEFITHEVPHEPKLGNSQLLMFLMEFIEGFSSLYKIQLPVGHGRSLVGVYNFGIPHRMLESEYHREDLDPQLKGLFIVDGHGNIERWRSSMDRSLRY